MDQQRAGSDTVREQTLTLVPQTLRTTPLPSPKQIVFTYDPDTFEEFVKEWVPALDLQPEYTLVERHGGAGDRGIDVAGYLSPQRLEGEWHNYQCKHYNDGLTWSSAAHEMRKMFIGVVEGAFTLPTRYVFVAPKISRSLVRQLAKPSEARSRFLKELTTTPDKIITSLAPEQRAAVLSEAESADFSIFVTIDMDVMLEQHRKTPYWASRFPHQRIDASPEKLNPPVQHDPQEARYVQQLVDVYRERWGDRVSSLERVDAHEEARVHLQRQREAFYHAEALRLFARDHTPEGHFEGFLKDVYDIVVEVADDIYPLGWNRLVAVLNAAGSITLTSTILTEFVRSQDRVGACHHLANDGRLRWCREGTT